MQYCYESHDSSGKWQDAFCATVAQFPDRNTKYSPPLLYDVTTNVLGFDNSWSRIHVTYHCVLVSDLHLSTGWRTVWSHAKSC